MIYTILIIDDIEKLCRIISKDLKLLGYNTLYAVNRTDGLNLFKENTVHVVLLDLKIGEEDGISILKEMKKIKPDIPVFMITGYGSISNAVQAIKNGAYDYIQKPVDFNKLKIMIQNAVKFLELKSENESLRNMLKETTKHTLTSVNPAMMKIQDKLVKFAQTDFPIFIEGESGTGKELIAEFVHANSRRADKELYKINCAAFSESLLDDELFGHNKGAFTGADNNFEGIFERANNSTLFFDEIGDMPLSLQAKILRVLQNHEVRRLGGRNNIFVDTRFVAATNKNISELTAEGKFREDLFFRLNTAMVTLPPLRERREDIEFLSSVFLKESAVHTGGGDRKFLRPEVLDFFNRYYWPGNVRELKNVLNYAHTISSGDYIDMSDLPSYLLRSSSDTYIPKEQRNDREKTEILKVLNECGYNKTMAAKILKMSRRTLYNKMEKYGIAG